MSTGRHHGGRNHVLEVYEERLRRHPRRGPWGPDSGPLRLGKVTVTNTWVRRKGFVWFSVYPAFNLVNEDPAFMNDLISFYKQKAQGATEPRILFLTVVLLSM